MAGGTLDPLILGVKRIFINGAIMPFETGLNLIGATGTDNPTLGTSDVNVGAGPIPGVPGVTMCMLASGNLSLGSGSTVVQWDNAARIGESMVPYSTAPGVYSAAGIGGLPAVVYTAGGANPNHVFASSTGVHTTMDSFVQAAQWTLGVAFEYTGSRNFNNAALPQCPFVAGGTAASGNMGGPAIITGLNPSNPAQIIVGAAIQPSASTALAQSVAVAGNVPHYAVATYSGGTLTLYLDGLAAVTSTGNTNPPLNQLDTWLMSVGSNNVSGFSQFNGPISAAVSCNVCCNAGQVTALQAFLSALA